MANSKKLTIASGLGALVVLISSMDLLTPVTRAQGEENFSIRTCGLKLNVDDMKKAEEFYVGILGFEIEDKSEYPHKIRLKTDDNVALILQRVARLQKTLPTDTNVGMTLQVNDLAATIDRMKKLHVEFAESKPRKEAVGNAIFIYDPFGRRISLMHQTIVKVEPFKEPRIYNFGLLVPEMDSAREFYSNKLGFVVRSEKYLPLDLPLGHRDKSFAFMLHYRPGVRAIKAEYPGAHPFYMMVFETDHLEAAIAALTTRGVEIVGKELASTRQPNVVFFRDPFGNISELRAKDNPVTNK